MALVTRRLVVGVGIKRLRVMEAYDRGQVCQSMVENATFSAAYGDKTLLLASSGGDSRGFAIGLADGGRYR